MDTHTANKSDSSTSKKSVQEFSDLTDSQPVTRNADHATRNAQHVTRSSQRATRNPQPATCFCVDLGMIEYNQAWKLQSEIVAAKVNRAIRKDIVLFLEHPSVFTLGRRGGRDYLQVGESFLERAGIPLIQVERGGFITFHGPGQLVAYPIIDLETRRLGVTEYVAALEEIMLLTVRSWGLTAQRRSKNAGIWIGNQKMGNIGIALRKGVSFHGLSLNINMDLTPFSWIQPCGLAGVSMTSVKQELGKEIPMHTVEHELKKNFRTVLKLDLVEVSYTDLQQHLGTCHGVSMT